MIRLGDRTTRDLDTRPIVLVPLGSLEQHGPHLPLDTDTTIAVAVAERVARARNGDVVVAPPVAYGSSGEHAGFAGTLSIGQEALELVVVELGRSADPAWHRHLVLVCGHGGNAAPLQRAVRTLVGEGRPVSAWFLPAPPGGDAHAGHTETSAMLALDPERVLAERAEPGARRPIGELMDDLRRGGVAAVAANGILGDPTGASAAEGEAIVAEWVAALERHLEQVGASASTPYATTPHASAPDAATPGDRAPEGPR
ncbi:MAG: mycofactocin biosynthesis peptidyl-dipeptidase MftE [Actinomycetota bacterium]|nr:mycofactocin biosynthesis peptidyl-dipeptidase MftE [Actinomycetota bacterium]